MASSKSLSPEDERAIEEVVGRVLEGVGKGPLLAINAETRELVSLALASDRRKSYEFIKRLFERRMREYADAGDEPHRKHLEDVWKALEPLLKPKDEDEEDDEEEEDIDLGALSPDEIRALDPDVLFVKFFSLDPVAISDPLRLKAILERLEAAHLRRLSNDHLQALVGVLNSGEVASLPAEKLMVVAKVLRGDQLSDLTADQVKKYIKDLSTGVLQILEPIQLTDLTAAQLKRCFEHLSEDGRRSLTEGQLRGLDIAQLRPFLLDVDAGEIPDVLLRKIDTSELLSILSSIPDTRIPLLLPKQVRDIGADIISLNPAQAGALTPPQLNAIQSNDLLSIIQHVPPTHIPLLVAHHAALVARATLLSPVQIGQLPGAVIATMPETEVRSLSPLQVAAAIDRFSPNQIQWLGVAQLGSVRSAQALTLFGRFTDTELTTLGAPKVATLLRSMLASDIAFLSSARIADLLTIIAVFDINTLRPDQCQAILSSLGPVDLARVSSDRLDALRSIAGITLDLGTLTPAAIRALDQAKLCAAVTALTDAMFQALGPDRLLAIAEHMMDADFDRLAPSKIRIIAEQLNETQLNSLSPAKCGSILQRLTDVELGALGHHKVLVLLATALPHMSDGDFRLLGLNKLQFIAAMAAIDLKTFGTGKLAVLAEVLDAGFLSAIGADKLAIIVGALTAAQLRGLGPDKLNAIARTLTLGQLDALASEQCATILLYLTAAQIAGLPPGRLIRLLRKVTPVQIAGFPSPRLADIVIVLTSREISTLSQDLRQAILNVLEAVDITRISADRMSALRAGIPPPPVPKINTTGIWRAPERKVDGKEYLDTLLRHHSENTHYGQLLRNTLGQRGWAPEQATPPVKNEPKEEKKGDEAKPGEKKDENKASGETKKAEGGKG